MKNKKRKIVFIMASIFFATLSFFVGRVNAAKFSFATDEALAVERSFVLTVSIDAEKQVLNAIGGEVVFPEDMLAVRSINDGNSMINFWIEPPRVQNNKIIFSGMTPGGYYGDEARLFDITFVPKKSGTGQIAFKNILALLNDGSGSAASVSASPWSFAIELNGSPGGSQAQSISDLDLPESFVPEISSTPSVFGGEYFLSFSTLDKGTGIDHFEIMETRNEVVGSRKWSIGTSPYLLKDQQLKSYIYVKAVDKNGNATIAKLDPANALFWYENTAMWGIMSFMAVVAAVFIIWRTNARRKN